MGKKKMTGVFQGMLWDRKTIQYGFSFCRKLWKQTKGILQANEVLREKDEKEQTVIMVQGGK